MASERIQRQVDRLLDQAEEAVGSREWVEARDLAQRVFVPDPEDREAATLLAAGERGLSEFSASEPASTENWTWTA